MKIIPLSLKDSYLIKPDPFEDNRGQFVRIFCTKEMSATGLKKNIVQINHSLTVQKGAVRGMHFQYPPKAEIKMVKCLNGKVFDVIVDLRKNSPTFLKWHGEILSEENMKMIYIPEGFAHGFQTMEKNCKLLYFHTEFYNPEFEGSVRYNDPVINIFWPMEVTDISSKDRKHPLLPDDFSGI
ncbi:MAG: dTDP-4-dehydrorhamnose 3,5-epimerase [Desulfobacteraceae bacterium]|nr:dTDP-4-dehydrorhamnose 3,5-epimerase [Desulfobacteraceae bacterium]